ncbi:endonuclease domain-containing protein [Brachybacterium sp. AOP43-C2-M15]|uniref:endonuclease domain-containing protein n=1 Tax=Brachybacterium sp. AOP43-C2-M15 TaxID=3457661 RepID=UPI004033FBDC
MKIQGVILKSELSRVEPNPRRRRAWLRDGTVRSAGQWYVTSEAPEDLVALLALGVRPTCLDAAALHGLWIPLGDGVHVYRPRVVDAPTPTPRLMPIRRHVDPETEELVPIPEPAVGASRRRPQPLVLHAPRMRAWTGVDPVPDIIQTLDHAARCLPAVKAAILFESALHHGKLGRTDMERLLETLPQRYRSPLSRVRSDAQSGTETAVRWWLEERCARVRSQVQLMPHVRVDLLVGTNWVIECDSRRFHDDPDQYRVDRRRDLVLASRGYRVTRLTWEQVFLEWTATERMLTTMLRRREHRRALPA